MPSPGAAGSPRARPWPLVASLSSQTGGLTLGLWARAQEHGLPGQPQPPVSPTFFGWDKSSLTPRTCLESLVGGRGPGGNFKGTLLVSGFWGSVGNQLLEGWTGMNPFPKGLSPGLLSFPVPNPHTPVPNPQAGLDRGRSTKADLRSSPALQLVWHPRPPTSKKKPLLTSDLISQPPSYTFLSPESSLTCLFFTSHGPNSRLPQSLCSYCPPALHCSLPVLHGCPPACTTVHRLGLLSPTPTPRSQLHPPLPFLLLLHYHVCHYRLWWVLHDLGP